MRKNKLLAGILAAALVVTSFPASLLPADKANAAGTVTPVETTITKTQVSNPIVSTYPDSTNLLYGGDPSILVDGDTVYLYVGRDAGINDEPYYMPDWQCFSTKDLKTWKHESTIMSADKESITWANTGTDAWAGQIEKHNGKYYFYYCTWDSTSSGKQSIGVATSDSPTGPFTDIGKPLVQGTLTTGQTSDWNDIDPTVWVEKDAQGVEHRYLAWGNGKLFVCELNEDMISVKDTNGDGQITFGVQANGATSKTADIIEKDVSGLTFTEAPWIYRRKDTNGNPAGPYYLFYAWGWREEMAYATTDNLMDGKFQLGNKLMPPNATANTNHPAIFDWKGKTYFVYHNGSLPGGKGSRRSACITELHFKKDGSIYEIPETAIGITGDTPYVLYTNTGHVISHESFTNSSADGDYPYTDINVGTYFQPKKQDANWAIVAGKANPSKESYVSIQSENKPGLYLTVNDDNTVSLAQDHKYNYQNNDRKTFTADEATARAQTFRTVKGLTDENAVSFESVAKEGYYLCLDDKGSLVVKALADCDASTDFYLNNAPASSTPENPGTTNDLTSLKINNQEIAKEGHTYACSVTGSATSVELTATTSDSKGFITLDGKVVKNAGTITIPLTDMYTKSSLCVYSEDKKPRVAYTIIIKKEISGSVTSTPAFNFNFNDSVGNAAAVDKTMNSKTVTYQYVDGVDGKAIYLDGSYGLKLHDGTGINNNYSISYWMKPDVINSAVSPTLALGTFTPQYWINLSFGRGIWARNESTNTWYDVPAGQTPVAYTSNEWQHVVFTVEGTSAKLYLNGTLKNSATVPSDVLNQTNAAVYFGINAWDDIFKGSLDEFKIYDTVLQQDEIEAMFAEKTPKPSEDPQPDPNKVTNTGAFSEGDITYPDAVSSILPAEDPKKDDPKKEDPKNEDPKKDTPSVDTATVSKVTVKAANQKPGTKTVYLKKGGKVTLSATVTGTGQFSKTVTWKSSKKKVASVSSKGVVTAKAAGTAKITATSKTDAKKKATITVKVSKKAVKNKKLKLKATKKSLKKGKTYTVGIKTMTKKTTDAVTYKSSKKSVASVDKFGVVKAKKKGKATITVKCGNKKAKLSITVK